MGHYQHRSQFLQLTVTLSRPLATTRTPLSTRSVTPRGHRFWLQSSVMATIEQRGESVRVNWRLGGNRDGARQSVTFRGPPAGRMKLAQAAKGLVESRSHNATRVEVYSAVLGEPPVQNVVPTFRQWVDMWLEERARGRDIQPDTITHYRWVLTARVMPRLGHLRLTDITPDVIKEWVGWMSTKRVTRGSRNMTTPAKPLSASSVHHAHRVLHGCLAGAVPRWLAANPAALPAGARKHASGLPRPEPYEGMFLNPQEINLVLAHCSPHIHDLVFTALSTGLRLGELVVLQAQHIAERGGQVVVKVRRALKDDGSIGAPKSVKSRRDIPVGGAAARILLGRVGGKRPADLVFPARHGGVWTEDNLRKQFWWPAISAAQRCAAHPPPEPPYSGRGRRRQWRVDEVSDCACPTRLHRRPRIHDLRHTHASMLIHARWSPKKVQMRLGHSSYLITMNTYSHVWDLGETEELEAVERLMLPSSSAVSPVRASDRSGSGRVRRAVARRRLVRR